jgi:heterodisulfide reductase subunit D
VSESIVDIVDVLDARVEGMLDACTQCGKCVEVCPMPALDDLPIPAPGAVMGGVVGFLRAAGDSKMSLATFPEASRRWAEICSGSGHCIEACPEDLNPRFLLAMARRDLTKTQDRSQRRESGRAQFQKMSRGVRLLSRLQLSPALLERLSPASHPHTDVPPDLVFYTGCNLLKTPHIGLLCLDVLDRLGTRYEVHGGPSSCCGILQMRGGDDENALRQGGRTLQAFANTQTSQVLSWCPTCQMQFGETTFPVQLGAGAFEPAAPSFDMTMFPVYLASRLGDLSAHMTHRVEKRVAIHEHPGTPGVVEAVRALVNAVPGVELVELDIARVGYSINALAAVPGEQKASLARELAQAQALGVDMLVSVYHTEHREFAAHAEHWPFEVGNYMELVGASMGIAHDDIFKRLHAMNDVDAIIEASAETLQANGVDFEQARDAVARMLDDHILEVDPADHHQYLGVGEALAH